MLPIVAATILSLTNIQTNNRKLQVIVLKPITNGQNICELFQVIIFLLIDN